MVDPILDRARELIKQKRYLEARAVLELVDHPLATKWIARIDQILTQQSTQYPSHLPAANRYQPRGKVSDLKKNKTGTCRQIFNAIILVTAGLLILVAWIGNRAASPPATQPQLDAISTSVAGVPNWRRWEVDGRNYVITIDGDTVGHRDVYRRIGRVFVDNSVNAFDRVVLIYMDNGFTTFVLTATVSNIRAFVNRTINEDEFERRIDVSFDY